RSCGSLKKSKDPTKSSTLYNIVTSAGSSRYSPAAVATTSAAAKQSDLTFPPHRMLSSETVAANLPPLLESDIEGRPVTVKTEDFSSSLLSGSDVNPPILSPLGKIPQGFSQELAERLKADTPLKPTLSSSSMTSSSILSEKASRPVHTMNLDRISMDSRSNRIVSSSLDDIDITEEAGAGVIVLTLSSRLRGLHLIKWSLSDVADVLKVNGCGVYASIFINKNIDGRTLLNMSTDQLTKVVSVVEGPILRLCDLVQQLKACAANIKDLGDTRYS
ncbi:unnamed protein product, partial [Candidula unifasciata]